MRWASLIVTGVLLIYLATVFGRMPRSIKVHSCACGAHWWIKRWGFWRHLDASPFNDRLQNKWTIWLFEFHD